LTVAFAIPVKLLPEGMVTVRSTARTGSAGRMERMARRILVKKLMVEFKQHL
jgi:hypothetical protein